MNMKNNLKDIPYPFSRQSNSDFKSQEAHKQFKTPTNDKKNNDFMLLFIILLIVLD